jgi:alanine racemase
VIRGPVAEISLSSIAHNLHIAQRIVKSRPVIAVVKAGAYGHGAVEVSKRLLTEGIPCLAVAYTGEAKELREAGINIPVIVLFDRGDIRDYFDFHLIPVVYNLDAAAALSDEAGKRDTVIKIHVKIDTGMGRMGLNGNHAVDDLMKVSEMPGLEIAGLLSHFSEADLSDRSYAISQLERFHAVREAISKNLRRKIFSHIANSAAVIAFEDAYLDAVRPGLMLYGYSPFHESRALRAEGEEAEDNQRGLIPAMMIKTRILCIRNVPAGEPISYGRTFVTKRPSRICDCFRIC